MPVPNTPPESNGNQQRARQAATLKVIIVFLLVAAFVVGVFVTAIPLALRLAVAAIDVVAALVLALVVHQKFSKR
jgi:hypothetical protein